MLYVTFDNLWISKLFLTLDTKIHKLERQEIKEKEKKIVVWINEQGDTN